MLKTFTQKLIVSVIAFVAVSAVGAYTVNRLVFADSCDTTYGGGRNCDRGLKIEKVVRVGDSGDFSESVNVTKGQVVTFRIRIRNTGDLDINDLDFTDVLPSEFELVSGDLTQHFDRLDNGDDTAITITITARVKNSEFESGVSKCVVNVARVKADVNNDGNREGSSDSATVCYGNKVTELPKTGPEETIPFTLYGIGMIVTGFGLRKRFKA